MVIWQSLGYFRNFVEALCTANKTVGNVDKYLIFLVSLCFCPFLPYYPWTAVPGRTTTVISGKCPLLFTMTLTWDAFYLVHFVTVRKPSFVRSALFSSPCGGLVVLTGYMWHFGMTGLLVMYSTSKPPANTHLQSPTQRAMGVVELTSRWSVLYS